MKAACIFVLLLAATVSSAQSPGLGSTSEFEVNGLKVILKQRPGIQTVAGGVFVRGGSSSVSVQEAGIENLLLDVAGEASARFPRALLRSELARLGSSLGSSANRDYSVISFACTRATFDRSWDIFTDVVLHPALQPGDVERIKNRTMILVSERQDAPDEALRVAVEHGIYSGHPSAPDPQGSSSTVGKLTVADLRAYHQRILQTSRLLLVLVGDLDLYSVRQKVTAAFGLLPRGDYHAPTVPPLKFPGSQVTAIARALPTNYVEGVYAGPLFNSTDTAALEVANSILRERVFHEVRIKRSLSYAPDAFLTSSLASWGGIYVTTADVDQSVTIMLKEITRLKNEPITADVLSAAVTQLATMYFLGNETNGAQAGALARYEIIGGGWRNAEDKLDRLRKVTPADVQRVSRQYMHDLQFTVIGQEKSFSKAVLTTQP